MSETILRGQETATEPYTADQLSDLVVQSFRFSRGNVDAQGAILSFFAVNYGHRFTDGILEASLGTAVQKALVIVSNQKAHPVMLNEDRTERFEGEELAKETKTTIIEANLALILHLNGVVRQATALDLANGLLEADLIWLKGQNKYPTPLVFKSNILHYGFAGRLTGKIEYDHMFRTATEAITPMNFYFRELCRIYGDRYSARSGVVESAWAQAAQRFPEDEIRYRELMTELGS